ncbi:hypothetical protein [Flavobacterium sp.]|uniref:hypothetical protein n=1 Tax=Flavobacterium sp. TaxID=239 RepID=UPI0039E4BC61
MRKLTILLSMLLLATGCSSVKTKNTTVFADPSRKIAIVRIVAEKDSINHNGNKTGDFVLREDFNVTAANMHLKIDKVARSQGANLVVVRNIGWNKKGSGFYAEGTLYHVSGTIPEPKEEPCALVFMRDHREAYAVSSFPISIAVNNRNYGEIKRDHSFMAGLKDCNEKADVYINNEQQSIDLKGMTRYFSVLNASETMVLPAPGGLLVLYSRSKVNLVEIEDGLIGRLIYRQMEN